MEKRIKIHLLAFKREELHSNKKLPSPNSATKCRYPFNDNFCNLIGLLDHVTFYSANNAWFMAWLWSHCVMCSFLSLNQIHQCYPSNETTHSLPLHVIIGTLYHWFDLIIIKTMCFWNYKWWYKIQNLSHKKRRKQERDCGK